MPKSLRDMQALKTGADNRSAALDAALLLEDPAERLDAALVNKHRTKYFMRDINDKISDRADTIRIVTYLGGVLGGIFGGMALVTVAGPVIGIAAGLASVAFGFGSLSTNFVGEHFGALFRKEVKDPLESAWKTFERAEKEIDLTLKTKTAEIAASEKFGSIYDRFPEIRDHFIKNFNQSAARKEVGAVQALKVKVTPPPPALAA